MACIQCVSSFFSSRKDVFGNLLSNSKSFPCLSCARPDRGTRPDEPREAYLAALQSSSSNLNPPSSASCRPAAPPPARFRFPPRIWIAASATLSLSFPVTANPMSTPRTLKTRLILRSLFAVIFVAAFLFLPAGSLRYWQGWVFMALLFLPTPVTSVYFLKRDPQLVERRLRTQEKISQQKTIIRWAQSVVFGSLLIPGLDYRFGWSRVPLWLTILSQLLVFVGLLITLWVMKENSFASRIETVF